MSTACLARTSRALKPEPRHATGPYKGLGLKSPHFLRLTSQCKEGAPLCSLRGIGILSKNTTYLWCIACKSPLRATCIGHTNQPINPCWAYASLFLQSASNVPNRAETHREIKTKIRKEKRRDPTCHGAKAPSGSGLRAQTTAPMEAGLRLYSCAPRSSCIYS